MLKVEQEVVRVSIAVVGEEQFAGLMGMIVIEAVDKAAELARKAGVTEQHTSLLVYAGQVTASMTPAQWRLLLDAVPKLIECDGDGERIKDVLIEIAMEVLGSDAVGQLLDTALAAAMEKLKAALADVGVSDAYASFLKVKRGNGIEAWRKLFHAGNPDSDQKITRLLNTLTQVFEYFDPWIQIY